MASAMHEIDGSSGSPFARARAIAVLRGAWRRVEQAALRGGSGAARGEAQRFGEHAERHLRRISEQLREERFVFAKARGVARPRPGKRPRPIVVAPIESRVVQRALLNVLHGIPSVRDDFCRSATSFGGVPGRGVKDAIAAALVAVKGGAAFYLRSDVAEFFRAIPRRAALAELERRAADDRFARLLDEATRTELENLGELGERASLFPEDDEGVPQGCALSTLLGNVLLRDFDAKMNGRGITCLRYVDDFVLLGADASHVKKAFASAQAELARLGLRAYDPAREPEKASFGPTAAGFELLGCEIRGARALPSRGNRAALMERVDAILRESEQQMERPSPPDGARLGLVPSLERVSRVLEGFRSSYRFCDCNDAMRALDEAVDGRVERYFRIYRKSVAERPERRAALRGIARLAAV